MRKALYKKGDVVVCELYEKAVAILDVRLDVMTLPWGKMKTWEYKVRSPETHKMVWIDDQQITDKVKYTPVTLEPERHVDLCQSLVEYERYRDFLETLKPRTKADKLTVRLMKEIMENLALMLEGTSEEAHKAQAEIESLMR